MKILNTQQFNEKLNIKPIVGDDKRFGEPMVDNETRSFINQYELVWNKLSRLYDCDGDITIDSRVVDKDGTLKIKFGIVKGLFICNNCKLTSLYGMPKEIGENFYCDGNKLETLKGAPQKVGGDFFCDDNQLTSLEGAPQEVNGSFYCERNNLTSLEGAPRFVGKDFCCRENKIESLKHAPIEIGRDLDCTNNQIKTINDAPKKVGGNFYCSNNPHLKQPKTKPSWVVGVAYI